MAYIDMGQFCRMMADDRPDFNRVFFERDDMDIVRPLINVLKSLEYDKYFTLRVLDDQIRLITDYEEIYNELRANFEENRKPSNKNEMNYYDCIDLRSSKIFLLKVTFYIRLNGPGKMKINKEMVTIDNPQQFLTVLIEVPRFVDKYYFYINGKYYNVFTQIVDASTYNNGISSNKHETEKVVFKIIFGMTNMYRVHNELCDYNTGETVEVTLFIADLFRERVPCIQYILANFGLYRTYDFLGIPAGAISITKESPKNPQMYTFETHGIFVNVLKRLIKYDVVASTAVTIYSTITRDTIYEEIFNPTYWIHSLASNYKTGKLERGISVLDSCDYQYDIQTKLELQLPEDQKRDIFHVLRWMMFNFDALLDKDTLDVSIKRRRIGEYIAHAYAKRMRRSINRISDEGKDVEMKKVLGAVYTKPSFLLDLLTRKDMGNLITNADGIINDNDAISALKFTYKGISGLGENGGKVPEIYQYVDPTSLGILDLDTATNDPGLSGILCPLAKTYGNENQYFTQFREPNNYNQVVQDIENTIGYNDREWALPKHDMSNVDYNAEFKNIREKRRAAIVENNTVPVSPFLDYDDNTDYRMSSGKRNEVDRGEDIFNIKEDE